MCEGLQKFEGIISFITTNGVMGIGPTGLREGEIIAKIADAKGLI